MLNLSTLNPQQREGVTQIHGPIMLLAGAGTGKTRVITYRIAHMLSQGIAPESIVALSFTNKAAREMTERVKALVGGKAKKVWLGTFHSFCLSILRRFPEQAGLAPGFGLADTSDQIELVRKGLEEKNWAGLYEADRMHYQIGVAKNHLLTADDIRTGKLPAPMQEDPAIVSEVFGLYERQLRLHRVIDFDDCIYKTVFLLRDHADVRAILKEEHKFLMVDEYQDTNLGQLSVIEHLASDNHDVCVVGDDDQSIYSWRGAMYEVLERFEQLFPKTKIIKLEQNYRCTNVILSAANTVIKNNARRKEKTLWSASEDRSPVILAACEDDQAEAKLIAEKCITLLGLGHQPRDIGILYRAKGIELALREARIAYRTFGGQSFFERKEVKDFVCYFRLVLECEDRLALWRIINTPNRGIGIKTLEKIEEQARLAKKSPYSVLLGMDGGGKSDTSVQRFVSLIESFRAHPLDTPEDMEALGHIILRQSGIENDIKVKTENAASRDKKLQNLRSLPKWLATLAQDLLDEDGHIDRRTLLDSLCLDNDRRQEKEHDGNQVSLMTIHASKGLEFPAVFVIGVEEDLLPHKNSQTPDSICEERRLFYVALTRAKKKLFLSHCLERSTGFSRLTRKPSRFIAELPIDSYLRIDEAESLAIRVQTAEERKSQTISRLGALRGALAKARSQ